jgi:predicted nucleic acid-binding protein
VHLVDSSTLIAILTDETSAEWAENTLNRLRPMGGVFINQIVFSEICALFDSAREAEDLLSGVVERVALNWHSAWPAGRAYRLYKSRGGKKPRMLPDFLIAAHADSLGWALITNNPSDVRNYFPNLKLISPSSPRTTGH